MEPGPRVAYLQSYNPLDAKFTMEKGVLKVWGIWGTLVTHSSFSSKKFTKNLLLHSAVVDKKSKNIGLTIPGNCLSKSGGFQTRWISPWNPADFTPEIRTKSGGFHLKSAGISWNVSFCVMIKYRSFLSKDQSL